MKGLLFKEEMFLAATRTKSPKTQTRRVEGGLAAINENPDDWVLIGHDHAAFHFATEGEENFLAKPRYQKGETIFLKEPFHVQDYSSIRAYAIVNYRYESDHRMVDISEETVKKLLHWKSIGRWVSSMMMFSDFARYHTTITDVRCERLNDISNKDCVAEGYVRSEGEISTRPDGSQTASFKLDEHGRTIPHQDPRIWYQNIIESIHGEELWEQNPWVFVYEFTTKSV